MTDLKKLDAEIASLESSITDKTLADAQTKAKALVAQAEKTVADANAQQTEVNKQLARVEARETAVAEAIAKPQRAEADANRVRNEL
jgi:hypothetical protein